MFKVGDVVYCIKNTQYNQNTIKKDNYVYPMLLLNTPYIIFNLTYNCLVLDEKDLRNIQYYKNRFISEKEYQISKRLEKINKLKECLK